ncbi:MAG: hypothetical protein WAM44_04940 [Chthoniobacterales bacterium]
MHSQNQIPLRSVRAKSLFILVFAFVLVGCNNSRLVRQTQPKALASEPAVDSSAIVVIPNPYVDDLALANNSAEEAKQELVKRGYKVVSSEADAQIVAIPTVESSMVKMVTPVVKPIDIIAVKEDALMDRSETVANSLGSLGSLSFRSSSGFTRNGEDSLVIEGFRKDAWDKALTVNELQLQPVWKVRVPLPASLKSSVEGASVARTGDTDFVLPH